MSSPSLEVCFGFFLFLPLSFLSFDLFFIRLVRLLPFFCARSLSATSSIFSASVSDSSSASWSVCRPSERGDSARRILSIILSARPCLPSPDLSRSSSSGSSCSPSRVISSEVPSFGGSVCVLLTSVVFTMYDSSRFASLFSFAWERNKNHI